MQSYDKAAMRCKMRDKFEWEWKNGRLKKEVEEKKLT